MPTLVPVSPFDPIDDADKINRALSGVTVNENNIIDILCYRAASQRDQITATYDNAHGVR